MAKESDTVNDDLLEADKEEVIKRVRRLKDLVEKDNFLKVRTDDNFLLRYLRSSQFNPTCAFQKMQRYYSHKCQHPEWYVRHESVSSFESELTKHLYYVLEDRDRFGKRVFINKLGMIDTSKTTMSKQSQLQDLFLECILDEDETQKHGLSVIVDLKNFSSAHLKWLNPGNVYIAVKKIESLPLKKIEFHVVNSSVLVYLANKLIWPFLSAKTKENIHFHYEDWSSLHKIIDPEYLPQQYGGRKQDINVERLLKIIPGSKEKLSENLHLGYTIGPHT